jgi:hypothetical protein
LLIVDLHLASRMSDFDILSVFLAAIIHNYRHPGLTNQYLMASQDSLSLLYNDVKPVENFACSSAFRLLAEPGNDFFSSFDPVTRQKVRQQTVALVFATNLADHAYFLGALIDNNICMLQGHPTVPIRLNLPSFLSSHIQTLSTLFSSNPRRGKRRRFHHVPARLMPLLVPQSWSHLNH